MKRSEIISVLYDNCKKEYLVRGGEMTLEERLLQLYKNKEISENSYQRYIKLIEIIQKRLGGEEGK